MHSNIFVAKLRRRKS